MILDRLDCSFPMENVFASDFIKVTTYLLRSCWIYCDESVQESLQKGLLAGFGHLERRYYPNIARLGWYLRLWQESGRFCLRLFLGHRLLKKGIITPLLCLEPWANSISPPYSARQTTSEPESPYVSCQKIISNLLWCSYWGALRSKKLLSLP